jgi:hypothetical protein
MSVGVTSEVAIRDIWSPSRDELVDMTPSPQRGASTATWPGSGCSGLPTPAKQCRSWASGKGLWVAERLGADDIRMSYPGYIKQIPLNCRKHPDFACSATFIDFAAQQGWWQPGTPFDVNEVYGEKGWDYRVAPGEGKYVAPATIEQELATHH